MLQTPQTIICTGDAVPLLDQTRLPSETVDVQITDEQQLHDAIPRLVVRGAPGIGGAAAVGVYVGVRPAQVGHARLEEVTEYLATSRPTAVSLLCALGRVKRVGLARGADAIVAEALAMIEEDHRVWR